MGIVDIMDDIRIVTVGVDVLLLRQQRDAVLKELRTHSSKEIFSDIFCNHINLLDGIVNLLDSMLDRAEGHDGPQSR